MSRYHHFHLHISKKRRLTMFDKFASTAAFIAPLSALPQVVEVFAGNTEGVSLFSWVGFIVFSLTFFTYGIIHKVKPMVISNTVWLVIESLVVIGILTN